MSAFEEVVIKGGTSGNLAEVNDSQQLLVASLDFYLEVAKGNIPGHSFDRKFGAIDAIQASTPAHVWAYGITSGAELYTFSTDNGTTGTEDIDTITSDNAGDTEDITIVGLDGTGAEVTQTKALNGQTEVTLDTPLWRVNRAFNANGTDLLGNVYVFTGGSSGGVPTTPTTVRGYIPIGEGQTLQAIYTVPLGKTAYFLGLEAAITKGVSSTTVGGELTGQIREFGKVFRTQDKFSLVSSGGSSKTYNFPVPIPFLERTDFCPLADVTANNVGISWAFTILLVDN